MEYPDDYASYIDSYIDRAVFVRLPPMALPSRRIYRSRSGVDAPLTYFQIGEIRTPVLTLPLTSFEESAEAAVDSEDIVLWFDLRLNAAAP